MAGLGMAYNVTVAQASKGGAGSSGAGEAGQTGSEWQTIGWQGITIDLPTDWALTGFGGDLNSGSLRCDAGEPDERVLPIGLEVRWIASKRAPKAASLRSRADSLVQAAAKMARKAKIEADVSVHDIVMSDHADRAPSYGFAWRSDRAASGRIWYCETCKRSVIVQVYGFGGRRYVQAADAILDRMRCHGRPGWRTWGLYGLLVEAPDDFKLVSQKVMNIYLQLRFSRGASTDLLTVEQWSLANVQLKDVYLDEWFERKRDETVAGIDLDKSETEVIGHPGLALAGRRGGLAAVTDGVRAVTKLKRPAQHYEALLWECPEANKAYLIQTLTRDPEPDTVRAVASRLRCHLETPPVFTSESPA